MASEASYYPACSHLQTLLKKHGLQSKEYRAKS